LDFKAPSICPAKSPSFASVGQQAKRFSGSTLSERCRCARFGNDREPALGCGGVRAAPAIAEDGVMMVEREAAMMIWWLG